MHGFAQDCFLAAILPTHQRATFDRIGEQRITHIGVHRQHRDLTKGDAVRLRELLHRIAYALAHFLVATGVQVNDGVAVGCRWQRCWPAKSLD